MQTSEKKCYELPESLAKNLGIQLISVEEGYVKATMPVDERTSRPCEPVDILNGGASLALAETVAGYGSIPLCEPGQMPCGIQISANHVHMVPIGKHKTNSMVQTIATLIDETLMVMGAHLHVRMTDEEKAYLDAHFELIHIKKGEHLVTRGEEVCYLYYLESGIVRLWFPDKENREISARFIQAKEFINFFLSHEEHHAHYNIKALEPCKIWRLPKKDLHQLYELSINFNKLARIHLVRSINRKIIREEEFYTLDAEARYKALLANEKWLLRSIPLKDIASYIGITPQALSNIRKRI